MCRIELRAAGRALTAALLLACVFAACSDEAPVAVPGAERTGTAAPSEDALGVDLSAAKQGATAGNMNVVFLGSCPTTYPSTAVDASSMHAYVTSFVWEGDPRGALDVIDFGTTRVPRVVGTYDCPQIGCLRLPVDVVYKNGKAYVADFAANPEFGPHVYRFDVTTPTNPSIDCFSASMGNPRGVSLTGDYLYEAAFAGGLGIHWDGCFWIGGVHTQQVATGVETRGRYAYVSDDVLASNAGMLTVVDVLDPENPVVVGSARTGGTGAHDVALAQATMTTPETPPCAYVADETGLSVFDVSNPAAPVRLGHVAMSGMTRWVRVSGRLGVVAAGSAGFYVLDLVNPANPVIVGSYDTPGYCWAACIVGTRICVADGEAGFGLYRYVGLS